MRAISLALALLLLLCGCTHDTPDRTVYTPSSTGEILSGAEEKEPEQSPDSFSLSYFPDDGFNPLTCKNLTNRTCFSLLYESLFTITSSFEVEPVLCDTFSVSEDQTIYTITVLSNISFSDGSRLQASDVAASIRAAQSSSFYAGRLEHISNLEEVDDRTVKITLDAPFENLPLVLDVPILKASTLEANIPLGTGAYQVADLGGKTYCLQRVPSSRQTPPVDLPTITLQAATSANAVRDSFEFGQTNLVCTDPNSTTSAGYHCNYEVWDCSTTVMQYVGFNCSYGPFTSSDLRRAVTHVVDRASIVSQIMDGYAEPSCLPCSPLSPFYDTSLAKGYELDVPAFRTVLNNVGISSSKDNPDRLLVCSSSNSRVSAAQTIADALNACGMFVEVQALDYESYVEALKAGEYELYYAEAKLPANFDLSSFFDPNGGLCYGGIASGELVQLCKDALKNSGGYTDLFQKVMENGYICPVLFKNYAVYMARSSVSHLSPALDCVMHTTSGRTLADANVTVEPTEPTQEASSEPDETDETENPNEPDDDE